MNNSQIIIYQTETGQTKIDVRLEDETVWFTQKDATCKDFLQVQKEGNRMVERNQNSRV